MHIDVYPVSPMMIFIEHHYIIVYQFTLARIHVGWANLIRVRIEEDKHVSSGCS